jgi:hypothetical protein
MMRLRWWRCSFCRRKEDDVAKLVAGHVMVEVGASRHEEGEHRSHELG